MGENEGAKKGGQMTLRANCLIISLPSALLTIHENIHKVIPFSNCFSLWPLFHSYQFALFEHIRQTIPSWYFNMSY